MAQPDHALIACQECGCINEDATALLAEAHEHVSNLERDLRGKRSKIAKLERDRFEKLRTNRSYEDAMAVLRHWQGVCAPKAREIDSEPRLQAVLGRLNGGHSVDELKLCATGYGKRPYVTKQGRSANGSPREWFADAELIYRTAEHVRKGIALAATVTGEPGFSGSIERLSWRRVRSANRRFLIKALSEEFATKGDEQESFGGGWSYLVFPCPLCIARGMAQDDAWTLRVHPDGAERVIECFRCGVDETRLIAAMTKGDE